MSWAREVLRDRHLPRLVGSLDGTQAKDTYYNLIREHFGWGKTDMPHPTPKQEACTDVTLMWLRLHKLHMDRVKLREELRRGPWAVQVLRDRQRRRSFGQYRSIVWSDRMDGMLTHYFDLRGGQLMELPDAITRAAGLGVQYW